MFGGSLMLTNDFIIGFLIGLVVGNLIWIFINLITKKVKNS